MRNRLKRRLRELTRTRLLTTDIAADIVIRIRPDAYRAAFADLALEIDRAIVQLVRWSTLGQLPSETAPNSGSGATPDDT